jgi:hypothetical protein
VALALTAAACDDKPPTQPSGPPPTITAPAVITPINGEQLLTLRPTLRIANANSSQAGAKTYEFQVSDNANFTITPSAPNANFIVAVTKAGIAEGANGQTEYTLEQDLQPGTAYNWRARANQQTPSGIVNGPWSTISAQFRSRPGDPVIAEPTLSAPALDSTVNTVRPTLVINNASTNQAGAKTYEFEVSENPEFDLARSGFRTGGVPEGAGGKTSFLFPGNVNGGINLFWRARLVLATTDLTEVNDIHGTFIGPWSQTFRFKTRIPDPTIGRPRNLSPADNAQIVGNRTALEVENATVDQSGQITYEFEIADNQNVTIAGGRGFMQVVPQGGNGRTVFNLDQDLAPNRTYFWHARLVIVTSTGTFKGPYSTTTRLRTELRGENRAGFMFDPLTNGTTIGNAIGNITIIKGQGARFNDNSALIRYPLVQTLQSGEHSFYATNVDPSHPGDKTKLTFHFDGVGDPTTSPWRKNLEFRGGDHPQFNVWRMRIITGDPFGHEDSARFFPDVHSSKTYFIRERWGGGVHSTFVAENSPNGPVIENFSYGYTGTYNPRPHIAYQGAPPGRAGLGDASVSEIVVWDVFVGTIGNRPTGPSTRALSTDELTDDAPQ